MSQSSRADAEGACDPDEVAELRDRLDQARAGERRAQALLEATTSLLGLSDTEELLRGLAENAVRHIGFARASVYEADHDDGVLREVACAELDGDDDAVPLPGMEQVRMVEPTSAPIDLRPGSTLAEFALGDRSHLSLAEDGSPLDGEPCVLVQMKVAGGSGASRRTSLLGVVAASAREGTITRRQIALLRALAAMGAAAAEATRVESFRTEIVSAVSHELRTPLAAIRAYNELLLDEDAGEINEEQRLFLERIETTCMNLDRMVEDLLDLSQLRAGQLNVLMEPVDVVATIEHIIDTLRPEAARMQITLDRQIVGELPLISSNTDRLAQVLFNLVGNAVKYVGEDGQVLVRAAVRERTDSEQLKDILSRCHKDSPEADGECLLIEVIDDGPGIAADDLEHIFDEFYRGHVNEGRTRGSGLGLAIASRLTRLLGGMIEVDSTPGVGSTFYLVFPVNSLEEGD